MEERDSSVSNTEEPVIPDDSPGSSVSTRLQDEYDELLRCAVLVPQYERVQSPDVSQLQTQPHQMLHFSGAQERERLQSSLALDLELLSQQIEEGRSDRVPTVEVIIGRKDVDHHRRIENRMYDRLPQQSVDPSEHTGHEEVINRTPTPRDTIKLQHAHHHLHTDSPEESLVSNPGNSPRQELSNTLRSGLDPTEVESVSGIDPELAHMDHVMDKWTLDLKRSILAEFSQTKIKCLEQNRQQLLKQAERHTAEKSALFQELDSHKELLHTHQRALDRKDQIVNNLTDAVRKQRDKFEVMRAFTDWKIEMLDARREAFTSKLANRHHVLTLKRKVWLAWRSILENKWRERVERACQRKAQEVCMALTDDYEAKIAELNAALHRTQEEVAGLTTEREHFEENMKKAFMRGVCALNMEAMTMFGDQEARGGAAGAAGAAGATGDGSSHAHGVSSEHATTRPAPTVITSSKAFTIGQTRKPSAKPGGASKKVGFKPDSGRSMKSTAGSSSTPVLHPPISSVVVQRHPQTTTHNHLPPAQHHASSHVGPGPAHGPASHTSNSSRGSQRGRPNHNVAHAVKVVH